MAYVLRGVSGIQKTGNWSWEFYPPPYSFLGPKKPAPQPPIGLSGCGCGGTCGGCGDHHHGLGLFDSGLDLTQWGAGEWVTAAALGWFALSIISGGVKVTRGVRKYSRRRKSAARRKKELREEIASL